VTRGHQKNFSAEQPEAQAAPRVPFAHGDQERPEDPGLASRQGPQAPQRVASAPVVGGAQRPLPANHNPAPLELERLRARREFLYVAGGYSERRRLLVVQGRNRQAARDTAGEGFTTTKKVGGSVVRNRARRRMREAFRLNKLRWQETLRAANVQCAWLVVYQGRTCPPFELTQQKISRSIDRWILEHVQPAH